MVLQVQEKWEVIKKCVSRKILIELGLFQLQKVGKIRLLLTEDNGSKRTREHSAQEEEADF